MAYAQVDTIRCGVISRTASNWPLYVAQDRGIFAREGISLDLIVTGDADRLDSELRSGSVYDVAQLAADHVVMAVEEGFDLAIFLGVNRSVFSLMASPSVSDFTDLRGKEIAVDGLHSGAAILLRRMLRMKGIRDGDYTLVQVGGTPERYAALRQGRVAACMLSAPVDGRAAEEGFNRLGVTTEVVPEYQGSVGAASKAWCRAHDELLVRYIRAYVDACDWLYDPSNMDEALRILRENTGASKENALQSYRSVLLETRALNPRGQVNLSGLKALLSIMVDLGYLKAPPPPPEKYCDLLYYQRATGQR